MSDRLPPLSVLRPEVSRFWIRRVFREWPGRDGRWLDLAAGRLGRRHATARLPDPGAIEAESDAGLLYVPPVDHALAGPRDRLIEVLGGRGVPLLVQIVAGEAAPAACATEVVVIDLLEPLLAGTLDALGSVPSGAVALWPLLPGLTDSESSWEEGCVRLAGAGASCVQAVVPELAPADRRELAEGRAEAAGAFSRLFHGRAGDERRFAAVAARHGLEVLWRRRGRDADRRSRNQTLAELLALAGELWLRLGQPDRAGQDLFRASRWVEETAIDVRALALEGNLEIVAELGPPSSTVVEEWARGGTSPTVDAWLARYTADPAASAGSG